MKATKHQYLQQYVEAQLQAQMLSDQLESIVRVLNPSNQVFSITPPKTSKLLETLIHDVIADPQLLGWVEWWMYDCKWGTSPLQFWVNDTSYLVSELSFKEFLEIVDGSHIHI